MNNDAPPPPLNNKEKKRCNTAKRPVCSFLSMLMNCGKYFLGSSPFLWTTGLLVMVSTEIFYGNYDITTNGQEHG